MNKINAAYLDGISSTSSIDDIVSMLSKMKRHQIDNVPWPSFPYKPKSHFAIAHGKGGIFLHYAVSEKNIRAVNSSINSPVYEDSCVEFFISFDDSGYYNLEFNCIGTNLTGFGKGRGNRERLPEDLLGRIRYQSMIKKEPVEDFHWQLTLIIPLEVFRHHSFSSLSGRQCRANFYKCGDLLPESHYVTWSGIHSPKPDFHLPEFFGELLFE